MQKSAYVLTSTKDLVRGLRRLKKQEHEQEMKLKRKMDELIAIRELGRTIHSVLNVDELARIVVK